MCPSVVTHSLATVYVMNKLANVPHAYYMCDTHVIHVWCFSCIIHVIHAPIIYVYNPYNKHVSQNYMCNIGLHHTHVLHV